ncbi:nucleoside deaminase [Natrarchaeobaculum sulfurireducens]|uniref:CMP/dCMP deaminase zinc-binding protein n=1 Tax=Natrarchaeobaculum sulfurireducens TaxID=2044521 RepID=A0A346PIK1_9EURY|nr:nucleoside deaminase [Natrarchaeobaculum sulfurireducens]AXR79346.1 tRNA(Arg) A34 adenosine deaminase TadA [Natrarchaeobaculum sulfurireducens]AXR83118.1 CMP/dCMP deaminase zinc-binding protein [Natrarchaeobaculum sulfurireducens]
MTASVDEQYIRQAIDLAERAVENGNTPFGSLLVRDGTVLRTAENTTVTDDDLAAHPECKLARWAGQELEADERTDVTMYTSTEPCPMCASAIHYAGLGRVVFSVAGSTLNDLRGGGVIDVPCSEIIDRAGGETTVDGPVLEEAGCAVHESFFG